MIKIGPYIKSMPVECDSTTHQVEAKSVYFDYFNLQSSSCKMNDKSSGDSKVKRFVLRSAFSTSGDRSRSSSSNGSSTVVNGLAHCGQPKKLGRPRKEMMLFKYSCACGRRFPSKGDYKSHLTEKHNLNIAVKSSEHSGSHLKNDKNGDESDRETKRLTRHQTSEKKGKIQPLRNVENNPGPSHVNQPVASTTATTATTATTPTNSNNNKNNVNINKQPTILPSLSPNCHQTIDFDQTFKKFSAKQNTQKRMTKYKKKNVVLPKKRNEIPKKRLLLNGVKKVITKPKKRKYSTTESDTTSSSSSEPTSPIEPTPLPLSRRNRIPSTASVIDDRGVTLNEAKGAVTNCYFIDALSRLVVVQEKLISIFHQTIAKHFSFKENMGIQNPLKVFERHPIKHYSMLESKQNLIVVNNSFFFVELWNQFVIDLKYFELSVIFYFQWNDLIDKKLVQLDNIKCTTANIQYISLSSTFGVIVSWWDDMTNLIYYKFDIHSLEVQTKRCLRSVKHKVTSLFDINERGGMLFGYSYNTITIWDLESGFIMSQHDIECSTSFVTEAKCLWALCNGTFLYIIRENKMHFDLMSINGGTNECKIIRTFQKSSEEDLAISENIQVENGTILINCLNKILFYESETGRLLSQKDKHESQYFLTRNNFLIEIDNYRVSMKNVFIFLLE